MKKEIGNSTTAPTTCQILSSSAPTNKRGRKGDWGCRHNKLNTGSSKRPLADRTPWIWEESQPTRKGTVKENEAP